MKRVLVWIGLLTTPGALLSQPAKAPEDRSADAQLLGTSDVVKPADYPEQALRSKQQGQVAFELEIDQRGRVTGCTVQSSSGHALLDRAACELYRGRARYTPAQDAVGKPTIAKDQRSVRWGIGSAGPSAVDIESPDLVQGSKLVLASDYPAAAVSNNEQGAVTALVRVDADGTPASCTIEKTSRSTALDARTCELLSTRGRFKPARDEQGTGIAGEFRQKITWRLAGGLGFVTDSATEMTIRFTDSGEVESCQLQTRLPGDETQTRPCPPGGPTRAPEHMLPLVAGGRAAAISENMIVVEEGRLKPPRALRPGERLLTEHRLRVSLDATGKVIGCEVVLAVPQSDACSLAPPRFGPVAIGGQAKPATIAFYGRHYLRFANAADAGPRLLNPNALVTEDDYPKEAIDDDHQGRVIVKVAVDRQGKVRSCAVDTSSGSAALDQATCTLVSARARYEPAVDNAGTAVASVDRRSVYWKLEDPILPLADWIDRTTITLAPAAGVVSCRREFEGALAGDPEDCLTEAADLLALAPASALPAARAKLVLEARLVAREVSPSELAKLNRRSLISRHLLKLTIAPDGTLSGCEIVDAQGVPQPKEVVCGFAEGTYAVPHGEGEADRSASMIFTVTLDVEAVA